MIYFQSDYTEGACEEIIRRLTQTNMEQTTGYGEDAYCRHAASMIKEACGNEELHVHFLVGGTQTNTTVITAALRGYQGVLCADTGHINVHETGAIEACGHKVLALPSVDGKITARQIQEAHEAHVTNESFEHMVQPGMVYISHPTEFGTLYTKEELQAISNTCRECGLYLFLDGARLGYGLAAGDTDVTLADIAALTDVFYIGGTKVGALFGEAVVIRNEELNRDFRYYMKQKGGMLAKGRLLGLQFETLFTDDLYFKLSKHADDLADKLRAGVKACGLTLFAPGRTNQVFVTIPNEILIQLSEKFTFSHERPVGDDAYVVRFCTSFATKEENVEELIQELHRLTKK